MVMILSISFILCRERSIKTYFPDKIFQERQWEKHIINKKLRYKLVFAVAEVLKNSAVLCLPAKRN